jgi:hypothetical protein
MAPTNERNAAFDAAKKVLLQIIDNRAGLFASTIKGDITDADILAVVDAALNAAQTVRATPGQ